MKAIKKTLLYFFGGIVALCLVLVIWILFIVRSIPEMILVPVNGTGQARELAGTILLEDGSLVKSADLENFYLLSGETVPFKFWSEEQIKFGAFELLEGEGQLLLAKDLSLKNLRVNDCLFQYCYQHRLPWEDIPSSIWKGLMGIEDYRFLNHMGVDFFSIMRALWVDLLEMKIVQGGSTLTQQLVKNLFFTNDRSFIRKFSEMVYAIYIEHKLEKDEIMMTYLNEVYWGSIQNIRVKGIFAASVFYFGKRPMELDEFEVAILISLLKGPGYYGPLNHLERLAERANLVYRKLSELNLFVLREKIIWDRQRWQHWQKRLFQQQQSRPFYAIWDVVQRPLSGLDKYSEFVFAHSALALRSKLHQRFPKIDFAVKAVISSVNPRSPGEFRYYSKVERNQQVAINSETQQVGSLLKPIIYRIFREYGHGFGEVVSTAPFSLSLPSGSWTPKESHRELPLTVTLGEALLNSYNRPVIKIADEIGFRAMELKLREVIPQLKVPLGDYPAQLLGALELTVAELHQIYRQFVQEECQSIADPNNILTWLSDPTRTTVQKVVDKYIGMQKFFGKTGTSNRGMDNWFVFFDGRYLGVIWTGVDGNRSGSNLPIAGSTTSFQIFQDFVRDRGKRFQDFDCKLILSAAE